MHAYEEEVSAAHHNAEYGKAKKKGKVILSSKASAAGTEFISLWLWEVKCIQLTQATSASFFVFLSSRRRRTNLTMRFRFCFLHVE